MLPGQLFEYFGYLSDNHNAPAHRHLLADVDRVQWNTEQTEDCD